MMNERVLLAKKKKEKRRKKERKERAERHFCGAGAGSPLTSVIYNATVFPVNSLNEGAVS